MLYHMHVTFTPIKFIHVYTGRKSKVSIVRFKYHSQCKNVRKSLLFLDHLYAWSDSIKSSRVMNLCLHGKNNRAKMRQFLDESFVIKNTEEIEQRKKIYDD